MKRVLVSTDHPALMSAVQRTRGLEVVGCISVRASLPALAQRLAPDVVLVDDREHAAREPALQRLAEAERWLTAAKRVLLTSRMDAVSLDGAFAAGAHAVVSRAVRPGHLGVMLLELAAERIVYRPPLARALTAATPLSAREFEILRLAARGLANRRIAAQLCVTEQTIKFHLYNTYRKLGVTNRTEATRYAQLHALLAHPEPPQTP